MDNSTNTQTLITRCFIVTLVCSSALLLLLTACIQGTSSISNTTPEPSRMILASGAPSSASTQVTVPAITPPEVTSPPTTYVTNTPASATIPAVTPPEVTSLPTAHVTNTPSDVHGEPADSAVVTFSIVSSHKTTPDDVLREVTWFAGGVGGGSICASKVYTRPTIVSVYPLGLASTPAHMELNDGGIWISTCGWGPNESVVTTVQVPDGSSRSEKQSAPGSLVFQLETGLTDPSGPYTVTFEGKSGRVNYPIYVERPTGPRLYWQDARRMLLYNFSPNEHLRLFAYQRKGNTSTFVLVAWQEFQVNSNGRLTIQVDPNNLYAIVGDASGEVIPSFYTLLKNPSTVGILSSTYVAANIGSDGFNVHEGPSSSYRVIARVGSETLSKVISEPKLQAENFRLMLWWHIRLNDGKEGWVSDEEIRRVRK